MSVTLMTMWSRASIVRGMSYPLVADRSVLLHWPGPGLFVRKQVIVNPTRARSRAGRSFDDFSSYRPRHACDRHLSGFAGEAGLRAGLSGTAGALRGPISSRR